MLCFDHLLKPLPLPGFGRSSLFTLRASLIATPIPDTFPGQVRSELSSRERTNLIEDCLGHVQKIGLVRVELLAFGEVLLFRLLFHEILERYQHPVQY